MKKTIYFYPSASKNGYSNPYCENFKYSLSKRYTVLDSKNEPSLMLGLSLFKYSFKADIFIINWLESIGFLKFGFLQFIIALFSIAIIKIRKKKIIWIFHNIIPHQGSNYKSKIIQHILFKNSNLIITHSKEAKKHASQKSHKKIIYKCHPIKELTYNESTSNKFIGIDILIWGSILPYKGIKEFISLDEIQKSSLKILIIGKCNDTQLNKDISYYCNNNIIFENRKANFNELKDIIKNVKFVLFPYIGNSISSSGAVMDTIALGGLPIAPNIGAFKDLKEEGVCITYTSYDKLIEILKTPQNISKSQISLFIKNNNWESFANYLYDNIERL